MTSPGVSVVILAGGRSSRFGRDKLAEPIEGKALLRHVIDAMTALSSEVLVIAAPDGVPAVPEAVRVVHDPVAFEGPLSGGRAGLEAASGRVVVIVGGDMPDLVVGVLASMIAGLDGFDAVVLEHDGRARPLPMIVRRQPALVAADTLLSGGEHRLRALTEALSTHVIPEATWRALDPDGATLRDIDTQADLT